MRNPPPKKVIEQPRKPLVLELPGSYLQYAAGGEVQQESRRAFWK
jgi:hypothetical protein